MNGFVENTKGIIGIVRDGLITLIVILLLAMPATINATLVRAGFVEGDFAGFKWKSAVEDNNQQLSGAANTIESLQKRLDTTQDALQKSEEARQDLAQEVAATLPDSPIAEAAAAPPPVPTNTIVRQNDELVKNSELRANVLRERIQLNNNLLATVPPSAKQ